MKKLLTELLPISAVSAIISLMLTYVVFYSWGSDGYSEGELLLALMVPSLIFLLICTIVNSILLRRYRLATLEENQTPIKWGTVFFITTIANIAFAWVFDALYDSIDQSLAAEVGNAMGQLLVNEGAKVTEANLYQGLSVFVQSLFGNILGILVGCFIAAFITRNSGANKRVESIM
jgi:hypothetical protein